MDKQTDRQWSAELIYIEPCMLLIQITNTNLPTISKDHPKEERDTLNRVILQSHQGLTH